MRAVTTITFHTSRKPKEKLNTTVFKEMNTKRPKSNLEVMGPMLWRNKLATAGDTSASHTGAPAIPLTTPFC